MRKTWKVRIHKYVDGKWDNTIEVLAKSKKEANDIIWDEYFSMGSELGSKLNIRDHLELIVDMDKTSTLIRWDKLNKFTLSGIDEETSKKITYSGEIIKD